MGNKNKLFLDVMCTSVGDTGSCHLCVAKMPDGATFKFIFNFVFDQNRLLFKPSELDFALINHPDSDHIARLPLLEKLGFENTIYAPRIAKTFMSKSLISSIKTSSKDENNDSDNGTDNDSDTHNYKKRIKKELKFRIRLPLLDRHEFEKTICTSGTSTAFMSKPLITSIKIPQKGTNKDKNKFKFRTSDFNKTLGHIWYRSCLEEIEVNENIHIIFIDNTNVPGAAMVFVKISYPGEENINLLLINNCPNNCAHFNINKIPKFLLEEPITIITELNYESNKKSKKSLKLNKNRKTGNYDQILELLKHFTNIKLLLISNGKDNDTAIFSEKVEITIKPTDIAVENIFKFHRIGSEGLIKGFSSKF